METKGEEKKEVDAGPVKHPRMLFDYDKVAPTKATEPPLPVSDVARDHTPNSYVNTAKDHPRIVACRKVLEPTAEAGWGDMPIDWAMPADTYPASYPHFVRGRDSLREHITQLFTTEIALYDGAMGTMIQNHGKKMSTKSWGEAEYRGRRFESWDCAVKGNNDMLSITQPVRFRTTKNPPDPSISTHLPVHTAPFHHNPPTHTMVGPTRAGRCVGPSRVRHTRGLIQHALAVCGSRVLSPKRLVLVGPMRSPHTPGLVPHACALSHVYSS